jgi:hypothetical protein
MTIYNSDHTAPATLHLADFAPLQEAWDAWVRLGTQELAARELGLTRSGLVSRICRYRKLTGKRGKPTAKREADRYALALDAWRAWEEHGTIGKAAVAMGLSYSGLRRRVENYWDAHNMRHGTEPRSLRTLPARQARAAWLAWADHSTHRGAARALGLGVNTVARRVADHRDNVGMPADATPYTHDVDGRPLVQP